MSTHLLARFALAIQILGAAWPAAAPVSSAGTTVLAEERRELPDPDRGAELIGRPAPAWKFDRWIGRGPLSLEQLRGKVVLLRWWTDGCHFCESTLPAIEALRARSDDLVVIGVYHPKPPRAVSDGHIRSVAKKLGFSGPIAVDPRWTTLDRYWLDENPERNWTSVSFLIDREGRIRWVHGGGEYHPGEDPRHASCGAQYGELERMLTKVLAERPRVTSSR
jgi:hypothetical protein